MAFLPIVGGIGEIIILILLLILAVVIISFLRTFFLLLPAIIVAAVVWFLTRNLTWAGIAFLIVAILSVLKRR